MICLMMFSMRFNRLIGDYKNQKSIEINNKSDNKKTQQIRIYVMITKPFFYYKWLINNPLA